MAPSAKKSWIWTRSQGYHPDKILQIGQVLSDPRNPASALMSRGPLRLPEGTIVDGNTERDVTLESTKDVTASFNAWAEVADIPASTSVAAEKKNTTKNIWYMDEVEERHVVLEPPYIREVLTQEVVKEHYKSRFWVKGIFKRLYMIAGVRIARGAELLSVTIDESGLNGKTVIDGREVSVPIKAGGRVAFRRSTAEKRGLTATNFVWAYRLVEIHFTPIRMVHYTAGDVQSVPGSHATTEDPELEELRLDDDDPLGDDEMEWDSDDEPASFEHGTYVLEMSAADEAIS